MDARKIKEKSKRLTKYFDLPVKEIEKELISLEAFLEEKEIFLCPSEETKLRKGWLYKAELIYQSELLTN